MCGIAGIWRHGSACPEDARRIVEMTRALSHRGPDDEGFALIDRRSGKLDIVRRTLGDSDADVLLGVRRLAITDLGPTGRQPATNEDGSVVVVLNGALFNHVELRLELAGRGHVFRSLSDTEVIAHAYEEWKDDCVSRFNGMWAFLLWDNRRRRLLASRDRFGIKPLVISRSGAMTAFASEPRALFAGRILAPHPDIGSVGQWLTPGMPALGERTAFQGVEQLPPATNLVIDDDGEHQSRYWDWPPPVGRSIGNPTEVFRALLHDAVRLRMSAEVPVSLMLSGGLDSSSIAAFAGIDRAGEALPAFTASFPGYAFDETEYAAAAASHARLPLKMVAGDPTDLDSELDLAIHCLQSPAGGGQIISRRRLLAAIAASGRTVVLEGQGADELLAGYAEGRLSAYIRATLESGRPVAALRAMLAAEPARPLSLWRLLRVKEDRARAKTVLSPDVPLHRASIRANNAGHDALTLHLIDLVERSSLPTLLHFGDAISSSYALESRLPFLDHRLVEFAAQLPFDWKFDGRTSKRVLRQAMQEDLPPAVRDRRDKIGFKTPMTRWLTPRVLERWRDELTGPTGRSRGVYDQNKLEALFAAVPQSSSAANVLFRAASVERWWRLQVDEPVSSLSLRHPILAMN